MPSLSLPPEPDAPRTWWELKLKLPTILKRTNSIQRQDTTGLRNIVDVVIEGI
jgi:hypothetical protein